jgi:glucose/arabinose dehydrogenase
MFTKSGGAGRGRAWAFLGALCCMVSAAADIKTELITGGLARPVFVCSPPGDTNRLFIIEQHTGRIRIFDLAAGAFRPSPFMLQNNLATGNEQGLLGLAFHPQYRTNGFFYVNITAANAGGRTEVIRYTATGDPATSEIASRDTGKLILSYAQPESNHNGGWIAFGPDGYLYISSGDGGGGNDQHGSTGNGQSRTTLLGKILRIDVDGGDPYEIPESNPFKGHSTYREEIWAFGLRNPWRCAFDSQTGNLWIGDVGQGREEEIDVIPAGFGGLNFGWRPREGTIQTPGIPASEQPVTEAIEPVATYGRNFGASVTGGYVYRGSALPEVSGKYIFADYVSGRFWLLTPDASGTNGTAVQVTGLDDVARPSSFGEDARGELYVCDHTEGQLYRIIKDVPIPRIEAWSIVEGNFVMSFQAKAFLDYIVEARSPLAGAGQWAQVTNFPASETDRMLTVTNEVSATEQFFRLRIP